MGPLINERAVEAMMAALEPRERRGARSSAAAGGSIGPGSSSSRRSSGPTPDMPIVGEETFAPILYVMTYARARRGDRHPERGRAGAHVGDLHQRPARGRAVPLARGVGLRDRQRQHRHLGRRDRRRLRRREGHRRRPRGRLGLLEGLHAAADLHDQLRRRASAGPGGYVRGCVVRIENASSRISVSPGRGSRIRLRFRCRFVKIGSQIRLRFRSGL